MAREPRPLLNPVLSLTMEAQPQTSPGRGKKLNVVRQERLPRQQRVLAAAARSLFDERESLPAYGGRIHFVADMADDSLAPTHTPSDLFRAERGFQIVAPLRQGYLVEADVKALPLLASAIERPSSVPEQCDIASVEALSSFGQARRLRDHTLDELWNAAPDVPEGRQFVIWLAPFQNPGSQEALLKRVNALSDEQIILPAYTAVRLIGDGPDAGTEIVAAPNQSSVAQAMRSYRNTGIGRATVSVPSKRALYALVASGVSHRIDPVRRVHVTAPGDGAEPTPPSNLANAPIVGVVDGGLDARSYQGAEAWRIAPPLVPDGVADKPHGNAVTSLVVQGHAWNRNRLLPPNSAPDTAAQAVRGTGFPEAGAFWVPVVHEGNAQIAAEEVAAIQAAIDGLLSGSWTDKAGTTRALEPADIIVVAPYNAQVNALQDALPAGIRVGTVDKFQGQEAPVCLVSMTASSVEETPRGMDFLFSLNRINVAVSRAKGLALVFGAPRLREAKCNTVEQMRLVNTLCALPEFGDL